MLQIVLRVSDPDDAHVTDDCFKSKLEFEEDVLEVRVRVRVRVSTITQT